MLFFILLKQLRDQGLPRHYLNTIFQAIIPSRLAYALPAWGPFMTHELLNKTDAFLKRSRRYRFVHGLTKIPPVQPVLHSAMANLPLWKDAVSWSLPSYTPPTRQTSQQYIQDQRSL